jgi:hypothetical protein
VWQNAFEEQRGCERAAANAQQHQHLQQQLLQYQHQQLQQQLLQQHHQQQQYHEQHQQEHQLEDSPNAPALLAAATVQQTERRRLAISRLLEQRAQREEQRAAREEAEERRRFAIARLLEQRAQREQAEARRAADAEDAEVRAMVGSALNAVISAVESMINVERVLSAAQAIVEKATGHKPLARAMLFDVGEAMAVAVTYAKANNLPSGAPPTPPDPAKVDAQSTTVSPVRPQGAVYNV